MVSCHLISTTTTATDMKIQHFFILQKRRSGRNTNKRKKYLDDLDLNLSDEEKHEGEHDEDGPVVKPVSISLFVMSTTEKNYI